MMKALIFAPYKPNSSLRPPRFTSSYKVSYKHLFQGCTQHGIPHVASWMYSEILRKLSENSEKDV